MELNREEEVVVSGLNWMLDVLEEEEVRERIKRSLNPHQLWEAQEEGRGKEASHDTESETYFDLRGK